MALPHFLSCEIGDPLSFDEEDAAARQSRLSKITDEKKKQYRLRCSM